MHFYVMACVVSDKDVQNILTDQKEQKKLLQDLDDLLAPYSEHIEVEEYEKTCFCMRIDKKINPECPSCEGTGKYKSTANPKGKWDYFDVGGRWDGEILGFEQMDDKLGGFNFGPEFHTLARNLISAQDLRKAINSNKVEPPFAIVDSNGWFEKSYLLENNPVLEESWKQTVLEVLNKEGSLVIGCDCHD